MRRGVAFRRVDRERASEAVDVAAAVKPDRPPLPRNDRDVVDLTHEATRACRPGHSHGLHRCRGQVRTDAVENGRTPLTTALRFWRARACGDNSVAGVHDEGVCTGILPSPDRRVRSTSAHPLLHRRLTPRRATACAHGLPGPSPTSARRSLGDRAGRGKDAGLDGLSHHRERRAPHRADPRRASAGSRAPS